MDMFFNRGFHNIDDPKPFINLNKLNNPASDRKQDHGEYEVNLQENVYEATQSFNDNQLKSFDNKDGSAGDFEIEKDKEKFDQIEEYNMNMDGDDDVC